MITDTNSPTALALQQIAAQSGYNISGAEIVLLMTVAGGIVHTLHQTVAAYGRAGGLDGIKRFIKTGDSSPPISSPPPKAGDTNATPSSAETPVAAGK